MTVEEGAILLLLDVLTLKWPPSRGQLLFPPSLMIVVSCGVPQGSILGPASFLLYTTLDSSFYLYILLYILVLLSLSSYFFYSW